MSAHKRTVPHGRRKTKTFKYNNNNMGLLSGKVALITGAARGIGKALALKFAAEGADIAFTDLVLNDDMAAGLEATRKEIEAVGVTCRAYAGNAADFAETEAVVKKIHEDFGHIDILVNNAGIWRRYMPFTETTSDMWKNFIGVNILGTMYFAHEVLPGMIARGWGRIINLGSVAGVYGNGNMADYSMTKGAVISFTAALAKEVAEKGITVNCVSPGSVSNVQDVIEPSELPYMGRSGTHTENANLICFLASEEASYISGQNYQVDGCRKKI